MTSTTVINLTDMERAILVAARNSDFGDAVLEAVWTDTTVEDSRLSEKQARGVLSSLIQKGLIEVSGGKDSTIAITDLGFEVCQAQGITGSGDID